MTVGNRTLHAPFKHHGVNPAIAHLDGKSRKAVLKAEARMRATGSWGPWEQVGDEERVRTLGNRTGWVRDVRTVWRNRVFSVLERLDATGVIHAGVSSLSGNRPTWHEMQRIKDEIFGERATAVEIYPPKSDIVDGSDMFHLWILPGAIPFGLTQITASRQASTPAAELLLGWVSSDHRR